VSLSKITPVSPLFRQFIAQLTVKQVRQFVLLLVLLSFAVQVFFAIQTGFSGLYSCAILQLFFVLLLTKDNSQSPSSIAQTPRGFLITRLLFGWGAFLYGSYLLLDAFFQSPVIASKDLFAGSLVMIACLNINALLVESMALKKIIRLDAKKSNSVTRMVQILSVLLLANILMGVVYQNFTLDLILHIFFSAAAILLAVFVAVDAYWRIMDRADSRL
jgi:hypothetical protein